MNTHPLQVKLTKDARTTTTRFIIPKGTTGHVVGMHVDDTGTRDAWDIYYWQIDFGLPTVISLPYDSPLIQVVNTPLRASLKRENGVEK